MVKEELEERVRRCTRGREGAVVGTGARTTAAGRKGVDGRKCRREREEGTSWAKGGPAEEWQSYRTDSVLYTKGRAHQDCAMLCSWRLSSYL